MSSAANRRVLTAASEVLRSSDQMQTTFDGFTFDNTLVDSVERDYFDLFHDHALAVRVATGPFLYHEAPFNPLPFIFTQAKKSADASSVRFHPRRKDKPLLLPVVVCIHQSNAFPISISMLVSLRLT